MKGNELFNVASQCKGLGSENDCEKKLNQQKKKEKKNKSYYRNECIYI